MEMVERIWLLQLELGIHKASMIGRVYTSCVRSSLTYGSDARPLLADV